MNRSEQIILNAYMDQVLDSKQFSKLRPVVDAYKTHLKDRQQGAGKKLDRIKRFVKSYAGPLAGVALGAATLAGVSQGFKEPTEVEKIAQKHGVDPKALSRFSEDPGVQEQLAQIMQMGHGNRFNKFKKLVNRHKKKLVGTALGLAALAVATSKREQQDDMLDEYMNALRAEEPETVQVQAGTGQYGGTVIGDAIVERIRAMHWNEDQAMNEVRRVYRIEAQRILDNESILVQEIRLFNLETDRLEDEDLVRQFFIDHPPMPGGAAYDRTVNAVTRGYNRVRGVTDTRQLKDGEKHAIFSSTRRGLEGTLQPALFSGPHTHITNSLNELVKRAGVNKTALELFKEDPDKLKSIITDSNLFDSKADVISMFHDVNYSLDSDNKARIRDADDRMLSKLEEVRQEEGLFNYLPSYSGIKLKTMMEDIGLFRKGSFSSVESSVAPEDRDMYGFIQAEMQLAGYGRVKRPKRKI